jgi:amidohydrolase
MKTLYQQFENEFAVIHKKAVSYRRYLHSNPELSGKEVQTASFIERTLRELGIENIKLFENHGIAALIEGGKAGPVVGIRAEMDALPIEETNEIDYVSKNRGVMHACGHDVHMAILLGLAELLNKYSHELPVSVKLIFQPSEETLPGGAKAMIDTGVLESPKVDYMLALHVLPEMTTGNVGFRKGMYMASGDEIYLTLLGKGGHAAMPHLLNDPVVCAAQIVTSMQQVISRRASPEIPSVLSFGRFIANGRTNVIPDVVEIEGTFRTFDEKWRTKAHKLITDIALNTAESSDVSADVKIVKGYPVLINNEVLTGKIMKIAEETFGSNHIEKLPLRMTADDFAYYTHEVPSCYMRIGTGTEEQGGTRFLHTPLFNVDENSLLTGIKLFSAILLNEF